MNWNPLKWFRKKPVVGKNGLQSSGHMDDSERSAAFQKVKKLPQR